ncbi:MAG: undecaprenyl-diphosphate phosphatase [Candidatus Zixiibacteriota bacterium]
MTTWDAILLGAVQGLTEFLPVSSSGHLVLVEHWIGLPSDMLTFDIAVHVGTLLAVLIYFHRQLADLFLGLLGRPRPAASPRAARRLLLLLVIGSIPAGIIGLLFKTQIEAVFAAPRMGAALLMVTGVLLLVMKLFPVGHLDVGGGRAWWIGCAQAVAILPGVSRSGSTIATGCMLGVAPAKAAEFSFLLSIPAVGGAAILGLKDAWGTGSLGSAHLIGAIVAALTGLVALRTVFATLQRGRFAWFGVYCLLVGFLSVLLI